MRTGRRVVVVVVLVVEAAVVEDEVVLEREEKPGDFKDCRSSKGIDCMTPIDG